LIATELGIKDGWPVVSEDFFQWVIEDNFVNGRPPFEQVDGVLFTDKVKPYEFMKLRLLNSTHSAMSYVAYLAGHRFVDEAMADLNVAHFTRAYMKEVATTVPAVPGIDLGEYQKKLVERFSNPYVKDTIARLNEDGSTKFQNTILEALHEMINDNCEAPEAVALGIACFIRYMSGLDEADAVIEIKDPNMSTLKPIAEKALVGTEKDAVTEFIRGVFGDEVTAWGDFVTLVAHRYRSLLDRGASDVILGDRTQELTRVDEEIAQIELTLQNLREDRALLTK